MFNVNSRLRINIIKTILFNFSFFPLRDAIKFPVLIWGKFKIASYKGKIETLVKPHWGMLKLGITDPVRSLSANSYLDLKGKLVIGANVLIHRGMNIEIDKEATLILEDNVSIGDNNTIITKDNIRIGAATSVGNNTTFMDSDFHYVINTQTGIVKTANKSINIGINNWIGGNCIIKKGAITPKGTILAGPFSMISKNYVGKIPENCLIAGCPAKVVVENVRRVKNPNSDMIISKWFSNHDEPFLYKGDIESFCMPR